MDKKRILLVEDEAVTAMDLGSNLTRLGYEVPAFVASGEDAIRAAAELSPDLILMDISLAGPLTGIDAAEVIRKTHDIPIIFLTAHADDVTLGRAKRTEPFGYLPKPCGLDTLVATIEVALYKGEVDAQRRKVEDQLRRVQEEQRIILDNIGLGVLLLRNRTVVWANPGVLKMFGYTAEDILGKDTEMFYGDRKSYESFGRVGYIALAQGMIYKGETCMKKKDGSVIWCHIVGQAVDPGDAGRGSIWLLEDETERRQLEQALVESEEKFRTVADYTYDWEYWIGADDKFVYISPSCEKVSGRSAAAFVADPALMRQIVHPDDLAAYDGHRHEAKEHQQAGELEFRIVLPDGSIRWVGHACQPVRDDAGQFIGTRGSNRDITKRKEAELERERLVAELQQALAKVKLLSGFIPICASCKKIRNDAGYWQQIEVYIRDHSEAKFSHGICPDCGKKLYGEFYHEGK